MMIAMAQGTASSAADQVAPDHHEGRNEHVSQVVDHQIEHVAGPARHARRHIEAPRDHAVDAVHQQRGAEQQEHLRPRALDGSDQRKQRQHRARTP